MLIFLLIILLTEDTCNKACNVLVMVELIIRFHLVITKLINSLAAYLLFHEEDQPSKQHKVQLLCTVSSLYFVSKTGGHLCIF